MSEDQWLEALSAATTTGAPLLTGAGEVDRACDHIAELLREAVVLFRTGSPRAAFLAITALEETAKVHVGLFRRGEPIKRSKDPLFKHVAKHTLAAAPTVAMGRRLQSAIGEDRVNALVAAARAGVLVEQREKSLYLESGSQSLRVPSDSISPELSRELILFAIEAFDDALVGYTNHSHEVGQALDALFDETAGA
jgi:AbiV family abortive infection protein